MPLVKSHWEFTIFTPESGMADEWHFDHLVHNQNIRLHTGRTIFDIDHKSQRANAQFVRCRTNPQNEGS
jgi:hypothetical protein